MDSSLRLPAVPASVPAARRHVRAVCAAHRTDSEGPELAVSELATNSVVHAGVPDFEVRVVVREELLWVEVLDGSPGMLPISRMPGLFDEGGRGLTLAFAGADAYRLEVGKGIKAVCAGFSLLAANRSD
ncbi:ATP-binding protein [Yinghuangia soli]|uniref:ATP-binding protein n=1 Tax=Yinghuangia soli TaxID=2908204 RepID=A0AA41PUC9_9ACTN|nr:ATP-binding protein [Yinghuangia soli]MCF2526039.1 ATP-binding protein [Yinghuangia soli]